MGNETRPQRILIIGGVAAGLKSAAKTRRCDPRAQITVLERGDLISYGACGMPYVISGDIPSVQNLLMSPVGVVRNPAFFKSAKNVDVHIGTEALSIDRLQKKVLARESATGKQTEFAYDKLVIATGANPGPSAIAGEQSREFISDVASK